MEISFSGYYQNKYNFSFNIDSDKIINTEFKVNEIFSIERNLENHRITEMIPGTGSVFSNSQNKSGKPSRFKEPFCEIFPEIYSNPNISIEEISSNILLIDLKKKIPFKKEETIKDYFCRIRIVSLVKLLREHDLRTSKNEKIWKYFINDYEDAKNKDLINLHRINFSITPEIDTNNLFGIYIFQINKKIIYVGIANRGKDVKKPYGFSGVRKDYNKFKSSKNCSTFIARLGGSTRDKVNSVIAKYLREDCDGKIDQIDVNWYHIPIDKNYGQQLLKDVPDSLINFDKVSAKDQLKINNNKKGYLDFLESCLIKKFDTTNQKPKMQVKQEFSDDFM